MREKQYGVAVAGTFTFDTPHSTPTPSLARSLRTASDEAGCDTARARPLLRTTAGRAAPSYRVAPYRGVPFLARALPTSSLSLR